MSETHLPTPVRPAPGAHPATAGATRATGEHPLAGLAERHGLDLGVLSAALAAAALATAARAGMQRRTIR